jgi:glycerophosphoryl diester phosphodiesterase
VCQSGRICGGELADAPASNLPVALLSGRSECHSGGSAPVGWAACAVEKENPMQKRLLALVAAGGLGLSALVAGGGATASESSGADTGPALSANIVECPRLMAHRGGYETPPNTNENSMAAFERAADIGVWGIETDVWYTKDGMPVLLHDSNLKRTVAGAPDVQVYDLTYEQLQQYRLNNGEMIPTLYQYLDLLKERDIWGFVEYKDADDPTKYQAYLTALQDSGAKVYAAGFSKELMNWVHQQDPDMKLMWFGELDDKIDFVPLPISVGDVPAGANPGSFNEWVDRSMVSKMTAAGKLVNVWFNTIVGEDNPTGVGAPSIPADFPIQPRGRGWEYLTDAGVHWISTDFPDWYRAWAQSQEDSESQYCIPPAPKESMVECAEIPKAKKMRVGKTYTIVEKGCESSAGEPVVMKVNNKAVKKDRVKVKGKQDNKIKIKDTGKVKIKVKAAKLTNSYSGNGLDETWTVYDKYMMEKSRKIKK